ncbi:hypothetical protein [Chroococcidiopsis sp. CCALA 051]|uniref:hypothetical protein n=1 Tax=Chroococcidiopsis sp. CCALA 051 TaxID=869949 RepID=UPI001304BBAE|nr:hypothetical protein [Chroococcidiopsis sp. CCALA 051]
MNELELSLRSGLFNRAIAPPSCQNENSIHLTRDNPEYFFQISLEGVRGIQIFEV